MMAFITIALNGSLLEMSAVGEVGQGEGVAGALIEFQRHRLVGVATSTSSELFSRLMSMTAITLGMGRKARLNQPRIELMACVAPGHCRSSRHLGRIQVLPMRELFHSKLYQPVRERSHLWLRRERNLMAYNAQLVIRRCIIGGMTSDASRMSRKPGGSGIVRPLMAQGAVLPFMFGPVMVELQVPVQHFGLGGPDDIFAGARRCFSRRSRRQRVLVCPGSGSAARQRQQDQRPANNP